MAQPFNVREDSIAKYTAILKDEDGVAVSVSQINTFTLTFYNISDGTIINSRNAQNIKNANNVTVDSAGNVTWDMQAADNTIVDDTLEYETHVALFEFSWASGAKQSNHETHFMVENLTKVTT